jgi:AAA domain
MAQLILGREIVSRVLRSKDIRPYLDMGMDIAFMEDDENPAYASVFTGQDIDAWTYILRHFRNYGKVPELPQFRKSFPPESYRVIESTFDDRELTDLARKSIGMYESEVGATEAQRYLEAGDPIRAARIMQETARKVLNFQANSALAAAWDTTRTDIEERLKRRRRPAPGFGIGVLDRNFAGFLDGELYTILGRAKSTKTTVAVQLAYHSWLGRKDFSGRSVEPKRVMFVSFEVNEEGIRDRLTCYGAGVNPSGFLASTEDRHASLEDEEKIRDFWKSEMSEASESLMVVQPVARFTQADLEYETSKFEPDIVVIDGFYFMTDYETGGTPGANWHAHDNLARDLKALAMRLRIPVVVTHQVREKQLGKAGGGIDDGAMMGGTGLRMASFAVFTLDMGEDKVVTIKNTANRGEWVPTVKGEWDWDNFQFTGYEAEEDAEDY